MQAGTLDQRIELQELVSGFDDFGQPINEWQTRLSAWAAVEPLRGREVIRADAVANITDVLVKLRYRPGVLASMRIKHGSDLPARDRDGSGVSPFAATPSAPPRRRSRSHRKNSSG